MSLTREIPKKAMPVIKVIRRDINKPVPEHFVMTDMGSESCLRDSKSDRCPMGLHFLSMAQAPEQDYAFPVKSRNGKAISQEAVDEFGHWWDEQTDAKAACDAVWGKE